MTLDSEWRPPGWQVIEEGVDLNPAECVEMYNSFAKAGYYTRGGALSKHGNAQNDCDEAEIVRANVALLRDAWNTFGPTWRLAAFLTGVDAKVDPFYNPGAVAMPALVVKLNGRGDQNNPDRLTNGLSVSDKTVTIKTFAFVNGKVEPVEIELPEPANWRGHGAKKLRTGNAPANANGPHSHVEEWLKLCVAQGQSEIVCAFVPDNGDGWFQRWALTAQMVVRLGRVPCVPAPGIAASSPRGASALLVWVPKNKVSKLPEHSRACIERGENFRVPLIMRPRAGIQYAFVQAGAVNKIVDAGLLEEN